ncbi:cupredoxin domain-containing protein [Lysobacter xanthus]
MRDIRFRRALAAAALLALACTSIAGAAPGETRRAKDSRAVTGRITLEAARRQLVAPGELAETVIYFLPDGGAPRPTPVRATAMTYAKGFDPTELVVPVGSTVAFPNRDGIMHNVFSATPGLSFDLGNFGAGETRSQRFDRPGLAVVGCRVHRNMRTNVLVLETPYVTQARADGSFELEGLPARAGTLVVWHPRAAARSFAWDGRSTAPMQVKLVALRPRIGDTAAVRP